MRMFLITVLVLVGIVALIERTSRFTTDSEVFKTDRLAVNYQWTGGEPWIGPDDPVNVGANTKWLGLKHYGAEIDIPSYDAHSRGRYSISQRAIVYVAPTVGSTYKCENGFWTMVCKGLFFYQVDPHEVLFEAGGRIVNPSETWLTDRRNATLTIYKYF